MYTDKYSSHSLSKNLVCSKWRLLQRYTTSHNTENKWPNFYSYNTTPTTKAQVTFQTRVERLQEPEDKNVYGNGVF